MIWSTPKIELKPLMEIEETRPVGLVYSGPALQAIESKLNLPIAWKMEVGQARREAWDRQMNDFQGEVVYAVGGGLPADAAKYIAACKSLPMVCIPTALSVDAHFTWASGIREQGCVYYIETKPPDTLVVDLDVIAAAPEWIRAVGICDVFSIATGSWDWRFAAGRAKNPAGMEFKPYAERVARAILEGALDCAEAAGRGDREGLKQLLDCLVLEVQLTNQLGHARPEEGSEHYFAYSVENETGPGWPHADLLGPGILLVMTLQDQDTQRMRQALKNAHIPLNRIPETVVKRTLYDLSTYCNEHELPYGIAHELSSEQVEKLDVAAVLV
jgi:glycerol-1-phosphate dehydrogenase [NAD(P)+]